MYRKSKGYWNYWQYVIFGRLPFKARADVAAEAKTKTQVTHLMYSLNEDAPSRDWVMRLLFLLLLAQSLIGYECSFNGDSNQSIKVSFLSLILICLSENREPIISFHNSYGKYYDLYI